MIITTIIPIAFNGSITGQKPRLDNPLISTHKLMLAI